MTERQEQLAQLEQALLDATLQSPECTRDQLARALMAMDSDLPEAQVRPPTAHHGCPHARIPRKWTVLIMSDASADEYDKHA